MRKALMQRERQWSRLRTFERKADTRQKIQLGGLVKKAGLAEEPTAVLLGLLLEAKEALLDEEGEKVRARWRLKGDLAFSADE